MLWRWLFFGMAIATALFTCLPLACKESMLGINHGRRNLDYEIGA